MYRMCFLPIMPRSMSAHLEDNGSILVAVKRHRHGCFLLQGSRSRNTNSSSKSSITSCSSCSNSTSGGCKSMNVIVILAAITET